MPESRCFIFLPVKKLPGRLIHSYFGFNRQQRNGLLFLLGISTLLLVVRLNLHRFVKPADISAEELPLIEQQAGQLQQAQEFSHGRREASVTDQLFVFDPNKVSKEQLMKLGLSEKTAGTFIKFRERGFVFRKKEDLKKIYGISDKKYQELVPYMLLSPATGPDPRSEKTQATPVVSQTEKLELNNADSSALEQLRGVGPAFARRIIKYRQSLGGYVTIEQLKEVYGLTAESYEKIAPQVSVNATLVKVIRINFDDFKTVNRHPYISYELTKEIFNQRRKSALGEEDLRRLMADDGLFTKLRPYISYE